MEIHIAANLVGAVIAPEIRAVSRQIQLAAIHIERASTGYGDISRVDDRIRSV